MTNQLQQTRYDRLLRRVGGIIGPGSKVAEALSELFPVLEVETQVGELMRLMDNRICMGGNDLAAVAGQLGKGCLFNPAGSDHLVTITTLIVSTGSSAVVGWGITQTELADAVQFQLYRDTRSLLPDLPVARISSEVSAGSRAGSSQVKVLPASPFTVTDPNGVITLAPGTGLQFGTLSGNITFTFALFWRERVAEQSELNVG